MNKCKDCRLFVGKEKGVSMGRCVLSKSAK